MRKILYTNKTINFILVFLLVVSIYSSKDSASIFTSSNVPVSIINSGPKEVSSIALTFDDGPHPLYTEQILDLLKDYDIKATFFVLGMHAESYPDIIKRQVRDGHEVGNHSYSHKNLRKASIKTIQYEYEKTQEILTPILGKPPSLFRPPYGIYNNDVIKVISSDNSSIVLWTFYQDSKDWSNPGVDIIVNTTISSLKNGDIILFHDYVYKSESHTVEALKLILPKLIEQGYNFVTISELIGLNKEDIIIKNYN